MKEMWDNRYAIEEYVYGTEPNTYFKNFIDHLTPGRLLLPGEGEGRNAVYAARLGWTVQAIDYSPEARKKALRLAGKHGVDIHYEVVDIQDFRAPENHFDLIAIIFLHLDPADRRDFHQSLLPCLKPGGHVILEAFEKKQLNLQTGGPKNIEYLYHLDDILAEFSALQTIESSEETLLLDSNLLHRGEGRVIRYIGQQRDGTG